LRTWAAKAILKLASSNSENLGGVSRDDNQDACLEEEAREGDEKGLARTELGHDENQRSI